MFNVSQFATSDWRSMPLVITFRIRFSSSRDVRGHDHLPCPINGASFGAYLTITSQWSEPVVVWVWFQLKRRCWRCLAVYMQSSLDLVVRSLVFALYVYSLTFGCVCLQVSCISHLRWMFLSASVADWSSSLGGALSIASSVTLKSPNMNSSRAILCRRLSLSIVCQNCGWAA